MTVDQIYTPQKYQVLIVSLLQAFSLLVLQFHLPDFLLQGRLKYSASHALLICYFSL